MPASVDTPVICIGDLLWDMLPDGKRCGGAAANVIYHLNMLGRKSYLASAVGNDSNGDELLAFLQKKKIDTCGISRNDLPSGTVDVTLQNGIPSYVIHQPAAWDNIVLTDALCRLLPQAGAVVFGTLAQRDKRSMQAISTLLEMAPENALKVFDINLRQSFYTPELIASALEKANVLKINDEELKIIADFFSLRGNEQEQLAALADRFGLKYIIYTLGANGSALLFNDTFTRYPAVPCEVVDTVGCGDSFLAAWLDAILAGKSEAEAMLCGSRLSSTVASRSGAM